LAEAQDRAQNAFNLAHEQFLAGAITNLDLLTTEQLLVATDAAVAALDAALVQDQIALFKSFGRRLAPHCGSNASVSCTLRPMNLPLLRSFSLAFVLNGNQARRVVCWLMVGAQAEGCVPAHRNDRNERPGLF
jgi:hypothetical protein